MVEFFTRQQKADLAVEWLRPLALGKAHATYSALAKKYRSVVNGTERVPADRTIKSAIADAFREGDVHLEVSPILPKYTRDSDLEDRLGAIIWKPDQTAKVRFTVVKSDGAVSSTQAHIQAGTELANDILTNREIRSGDLIGVGSGRGVYYTVEAMVNRPEDRFRERPELPRETFIMSLMGSVFPNPAASMRDRHFDSDITASLLARCFDGLIHLRPTSLPIAVPADEKERLMRRTWLGTRYEESPPNFAIVGMGILSESHRIYQVASDDGRRAGSENPIKAHLEALTDVTNKITSEMPSYNPIADVCGRMFVVPPPRDLKQDRLIKDAEDLVNHINASLVSVTKTQLGKVLQKVIVIAAQKEKARGLFYLLRHDKMRVDHLATDHEAATFLLELARASRLRRLP